MQQPKFKTLRPIIGISCGSSMKKERAKGDNYNRVPYEYVEAIESAGGIPLIIPFLKETENIKTIVEKIDGLLLPGGRDVEPKRYGEKPAGVKETDLIKDALEFPLIKFVLEKNLPILGICRGCQVLNVAFGGTLIQDIRSPLGRSPLGRSPLGKTNIKHVQKEPRDKTTHKIKIKKGSLLFKIIGKENIWVNSFHHQAVKDIAPHFQASAFAEDGIVEAIESKKHKFILAVQCHIEYLWQKSPAIKNIFLEFIRACSG